jgi:hypothetical protein
LPLGVQLSGWNPWEHRFQVLHENALLARLDVTSLHSFQPTKTGRN